MFFVTKPSAAEVRQKKREELCSRILMVKNRLDSDEVPKEGRWLYLDIEEYRLLVHSGVPISRLYGFELKAITTTKPVTLNNSFRYY